ncbi:MAG: anthranilate phosphoribosyltransferase [Verrucomicrobiae bacterium]|nr:anthranilate phosphoribosyltransferase [Verrucomicrobiae bacterium]
MRTLAELQGKVASGQPLQREEIRDAIAALLGAEESDDTKAAFLTALARRGETAEEIAGFAEELRARALDPGVDAARFGGVVLDVCGTGGDMSHTFNISSAVMFVVAAAGVAVAKHGNRAITSRSGSADVLAALGARIELTPEQARRVLEQAGVTFLFAPSFHPAFKAVAPVRKKLAEQKQRTVFNILGPLVNPARPTHQVVGLFDRALVPRYAKVLRLLGVRRAFVVHGSGLDEFSTMGVNTVAEVWGDRIELTERDYTVPHTEPRLKPVSLAELAGGTPEQSAQIIRDIFRGQNRGPCRDIVLLNAAAALVLTGRADDFRQGWDLAAEIVDSGRAQACVERFVAATHSV